MIFLSVSLVKTRECFKVRHMLRSIIGSVSEKVCIFKVSSVFFFRLDPGLWRGEKKSRLLSRISQRTFSILIKPIVSMQLICKVISIFPVRLHETVSE